MHCFGLHSSGLRSTLLFAFGALLAGRGSSTARTGLNGGAAGGLYEVVRVGALFGLLYGIYASTWRPRARVISALKEETYPIGPRFRVHAPQSS